MMTRREQAEVGSAGKGQAPWTATVNPQERPKMKVTKTKPASLRKARVLAAGIAGAVLVSIASGQLASTAQAAPAATHASAQSPTTPAGPPWG
jgi:hypothetical protein